ncbi:MAG: aminoglycoside phosphotransferase family protein [Actinobacteria bacterium]|nr:MAG: aminoglycoside phosphotransferase family protein [Actinomycetota bacterium]
MTEEELGGGGLTPVVRVGETVRRTTGPWTPAVHALLQHLAAAGFDGAPRVEGFDDQGREVLGYVAGEVRDSYDDEELIAVAELIRRLHDATTTFQPPDDAAWQRLVGTPQAAEVICHNDLSPSNLVWSDGRPRAFVDWDLAAPGPRSWDVGYALYRFVPLYSDDDLRAARDPDPSTAASGRSVLPAYGVDVTPGLLDDVERRVRALYDSARAWGEAGAPGWSEVWTATRGEQWLRSLRFVQEHRREWVG